MSPRALGTVWSFLGVLAFGFALTSVLRSTGSDVSDYLIPLGSAEPYSAALVSWPLAAVFAASVLYVTRLYTRHPAVTGRRQWESRIPVFYFEAGDVDPETPVGARYQRLIAIAFVVLPLLLQVVLLIKIAQGTVFAPDGAEFVKSLGEQFWPPMPVNWSNALSGMYRFGCPDTGVTYYPLLTPYVYTAAELALIVYATTVWRELRAAKTAQVEG